MKLVVNASGDIAFAARPANHQLKAELDDFLSTRRQGTLFGNVTLSKYHADTRWVRNATTDEELAKFTRLAQLARQ